MMYVYLCVSFLHQPTNKKKKKICNFLAKFYYTAMKKKAKNNIEFRFGLVNSSQNT